MMETALCYFCNTPIQSTLEGNCVIEFTLVSACQKCLRKRSVLLFYAIFTEFLWTVAKKSGLITLMNRIKGND